MLSEVYSLLQLSVQFKCGLTKLSVTLREYWFFWKILLRFLRFLLTHAQELSIFPTFCQPMFSQVKLINIRHKAETD